MEIEEAIESLKLKFTSGNPIEVERATILRKEWDAILSFITNNKKPETMEDIFYAAIHHHP